MGSCCATQEAQPGALWQRRGVRWGGLGWEGGSRGRGYMYMCVCVCVCVCASHQSCLTLSDPMDCNLQSSSVHEILQARILEWVAISFSRGSSWPRDRTQVEQTIAGRFLTIWATREAHGYRYIYINTYTYTQLWLIPVVVWQKPIQHCKAIIL